MYVPFFISYRDSLVCTFLLYLNCSTFSLSGPGAWLPEAPANSTPQLKWLGTHFSQRPSVSYTSIHAPDICIYLCLIWAHLEFLQMFLYLNHTLQREGKETCRGRRCFTVSHLFWSGSDARKMCTSLMIFLICSSLRLPPQKNTNRNSSLPYLLIKSLCLQ